MGGGGVTGAVDLQAKAAIPKAKAWRQPTGTCRARRALAEAKAYLLAGFVRPN